MIRTPLIVSFLAACGRHEVLAVTAGSSDTSSRPSSLAPTLALSAATTRPLVGDDDLDAAFAEARASKKVVFVDGWAPWCAPCDKKRDAYRMQSSRTRLEDLRKR
jgi:thiol-disulfide isomerase/thioredoxin